MINILRQMKKIVHRIDEPIIPQNDPSFRVILLDDNNKSSEIYIFF